MANKFNSIQFNLNLLGYCGTSKLVDSLGITSDGPAVISEVDLQTNISGVKSLVCPTVPDSLNTFRTPKLPNYSFGLSENNTFVVINHCKWLKLRKWRLIGQLTKILTSNFTPLNLHVSFKLTISFCSSRGKRCTLSVVKHKHFGQSSYLISDPFLHICTLRSKG